MSTASIQHLSRKSIDWPPQERKLFDADALNELAQTIRVHGILEPLGVVRNGERYTGLWGQRRWIAAGLAGLETVPAIVRDKPANESEAMEVRLIENVAREGLTALEQASALDQLIKASGLTANEVSSRVGMKPAAVSKLLAILTLPEEIRRQIDSGAISAASAYELTQVPNAAIQAELAEKVASGALNRDALASQVKTLCKAASGSLGRGRQRRQFRVTARLDGGRQVTVCGNGLTLDSVIVSLETLLARLRTGRSKRLGLSTILRMLADETGAMAKSSDQAGPGKSNVY